MVEKVYGIRKYTCSDKTKRPQKNPLDLKKLEKRNSSQRRLYITLDNIEEIFSQNDDKYPVCYDLIFNTIQGKVTKYFNTRSYDRKKELSYDCMNVLYSTLKRKLLRLKDNQGLLNPPPVLFFYLSQFFRYIDLVVFSVVHYGTIDTKYMIQEPDDFKTDDVLNEAVSDYFEDEENIYSTEDKDTLDAVDKNDYSTDLDDIEYIFDDNSYKIKNCIETNSLIDDKEKKVLLKVYKNAYSLFGSNSLTKREVEILDSIKQRLLSEPELLKDLEEILHA